MSWTKDRDRSRGGQVDALVREAYERAIGPLLRFEDTADGTEEQRRGVDHYAVPLDGGRLRLETKVRHRAFGGDVLFERGHLRDGGAADPGWAIVKSDWDYLAMVWVGGRTPTAMVWRQLHEVVGAAEFRRLWLRQWPTVESRRNNASYTTINAAVPWSRTLEEVPGWKCVWAGPLTGTLKVAA